MSGKQEIATLAAGCFWCVEAVFQDLKGVRRVVSGYAGGATDDPTYEEVCTGRSGHAEAVQVTFDPEVLPFKELLEVFWRAHDPTTLNRQGADAGPQYRSAIFYHDEEQRVIAERSRSEAEMSGLWSDPIVTEITPFSGFHPAEPYHQGYYRRNPAVPYCRMVIDPKLRKLRKELGDRLEER